MSSSVILAVLVLFMVVAWMSGHSFLVDGYNVQTPSAKKWWMDSASALEPFTNPDGSMKGADGSKKAEDDGVVENALAPVDLQQMEPYHLLSDVLGRTRDSLSSVTSRSCYAVDAEAYLSKVGNFRQLTNNYKREYPDDCSAPRQELVLNFYGAKPITVSGSGF